MTDRKEYLKQYRLSHKENYREYNKKYRETHLTTYDKLKQENEKLNHYKLLYQKVKERNDKAIEFVEEYMREDYYEELDEYITHFTWNMTKEDLLDILSKNEVSDDNN